MNPHDVDLGDFPTWISAVVALAALVAAIWAGRAAWRVVSVERGRDEERQRLDARAQADLVAAWPELVLSDPADPDSPLIWGAAVRNASQLPIHQVHVEYVPIKPGRGGVHVTLHELVPPGDFLMSDRELYRRPEQRPVRRGPDDLPDRWYFVELRFNDMSERRWHRDRHGNLVRVDPQL